MICKNCGKEFDSNYSNCPYCHCPAYPQGNSDFYSNNQFDQSNNQGSHNNQGYNEYNNFNNQQPYEASDVITLMKVLGFFLGLLMPIFWFLPLISLVIYFLWRKSKPKTAAAIGKFTIIGLVVGWILAILLITLAIVIFIAFAAGPLFEFTQDLIVEIIRLIPFEPLRHLIKNIFNLLPFSIDFHSCCALIFSFI